MAAMVIDFAERLARIHEHNRRFRSDMHAYQDGDEGIVQFLKDNPFSAAFLDTGLGKTVSALTLISDLTVSEQITRTLVVAPIRVANQTWPGEIAEWQHVCWLDYEVIRAEDDDPEVISAGRQAIAEFKARPDYQELKEQRAWLDLFAVTPEQRAAVLAIPTATGTGARARTAKKEEIRCRKAATKKTLHIIDIEHLEWLIDLHSEWKIVKRRGSEKRIRVIKDWPYDCVIIDESSKFKDYKTDRYRALNAVRSHKRNFIKRMHELTATPAAESYLGLFAQIHLLDQGERLGSSITAYRDNYFRLKPRSKYVWQLMPGMREKIGDLIADISMVMKSKDYLEEQDPLFLPRRIRFSPLELKQYKRFEREFILTVKGAGEDGEDLDIEAVNAASLSGKLLQLSSGAVYDENKRVHELHRHKLEDVEELVDELDGKPIMIAYWYKSSLSRLRKLFPKAVVADRQGKFVKPWNQGKIKILLVHPAGIGHGLNMQYGPCQDIYYFDMCWSYELYYQLYRRIHRQGQDKQVRVHLPQMVGTNDELVADRLLDKEDAQEALFERIRMYRRRMKARQIEMRMAA